MFARPHRLGLLVTAALVPAAAVAGYAVAGGTPAQPTRTDLAGATKVAGAEGRTLGLARVVIPPHSQLALHTHPGTEVAHIEEGTLSYDVQRGSVRVMRGDAGDARVVRRIGAGQSGKIREGEWIVEQPTMVHSAANDTDQRVVVLLATLFPDGAPASEPAR